MQSFRDRRPIWEFLSELFGRTIRFDRTPRYEAPDKPHVYRGPYRSSNALVIGLDDGDCDYVTAKVHVNRHPKTADVGWPDDDPDAAATAAWIAAACNAYSEKETKPHV